MTYKATLKVMHILFVTASVVIVTTAIAGKITDYVIKEVDFYIKKKKAVKEFSEL